MALTSVSVLWTDNKSDLMSASDPIARLVDERNAAIREYHMVMSERDSVHREMERLTESLTEVTRRAQGLEREKKQAVDEVVRLKREVTALQHEKERVQQECYELRLKYNVSTKYSSKVSDDSHMPLAAIRSSLSRVTPAQPLRGWPTPSITKSPVRDVSLMALNQEIDAIRMQMAQLEIDLYESKNEAEMSNRRRDWAIAEKKKMGLERESLKQLCECLRKEGNQRDRELAKVLIENEELKRQLSDAIHALHEHHNDKLHADRSGNETESPLSSSAACSSDPLILPTACSRDSAIYADLLEAETDHLHIDVNAKIRGNNNHITCRPHTSPPLTCPVSRQDACCSVPHHTSPDRPKPGEVRDILISNKSVEPLGIGIFWNEKNGSIFVSAVSENSIAAQAGIQVGDQLLDINGVNMRCQATRKIASTVLCQTKKSEDDLKIRVQYNPDKFEDCYPKVRDDAKSGPSSSPLPAIPSSRCQSLAGETGRRKAGMRETGMREMCIHSCKKL